MSTHTITVLGFTAIAIALIALEVGARSRGCPRPPAGQMIGFLVQNGITPLRIPPLWGSLTAVVRSAYARWRGESGPRGYEGWIYRRKARAKPNVKMWSAEAERMLTLREEHRLAGIVRVPSQPAEWPAEVATA